MKKQKDANDKPPYLVFRTCKDKCFACIHCGYFWGPGHNEKNGQPATWTPVRDKNGEENHRCR